MGRSYWLKLGFCVTLLLAIVASLVAGPWYASFARPWSGLAQVTTGVGELISPMVVFYFFVLVFAPPRQR